MDTLEQQLESEKLAKKEKLKDLFYVDYCNHCKEETVRGTYGQDYTPCHHPWYCWNDGGDVQELEFRMGQIKQDSELRGFMCAHEYEELKVLKSRKWDLIKKGRREMPRVKH